MTQQAQLENSEQFKIFNYYCLDRCKSYTNEFVITYTDRNNILRKKKYKIGLRSKVKHIECFCLYTESDEDLNQFIFIPTSVYYEWYDKFYKEVLSIEEVEELIKRITTINIFEYTSLLDFINIYQDFKEFIEYNWKVIDMDNLIEV